MIFKSRLTDRPRSKQSSPLCPRHTALERSPTARPVERSGPVSHDFVEKIKHCWAAVLVVAPKVWTAAVWGVEFCQGVESRVWFGIPGVQLGVLIANSWCVTAKRVCNKCFFDFCVPVEKRSDEIDTHDLKGRLALQPPQSSSHSDHDFTAHLNTLSVVST